MPTSENRASAPERYSGDRTSARVDAWANPVQGFDAGGGMTPPLPGTALKVPAGRSPGWRPICPARATGLPTAGTLGAGVVVGKVVVVKGKAVGGTLDPAKITTPPPTARRALRVPRAVAKTVGRRRARRRLVSRREKPGSAPPASEGPPVAVEVSGFWTRGAGGGIGSGGATIQSGVRDGS
jgi:hypothetical protein